jgi:hypothetical protein
MTLISQNKLIKEQGWNLSLIRKYLPDADKELFNPIEPFYPTMKLYDMETIKSIMNRSDFRADQRKSNERSRKIRATKREKRMMKE